MITSSKFMIDFRLTQETVTGQIKRRRKERPQKKTSSKRGNANKLQKNLFSKKVEGVHMDLLTCESSVRQFTFKVLDTMGYIKEVTLKKIILDMLFFLVQLRLSSSYVDFSQCL